MPQGFQRIAVVGAGAVGSYFGAMLARAGQAVTLIARAPHVQAIRAHGLQLHMHGQVHTVAITATTELDAVRDADIVLFCVKSRDTDSLARELAPRLRPGALVLSLQNGVENPDVLARHLRNPVIPVVVYVAVAMPAPGEVQHFGRGDLVVGAMARDAGPDMEQRLSEVAQRFGAADIGVAIVPDVIGELWRKLLINCAYNAISALSQLPYGRMAQVAEILPIQEQAVREVIAVAAALGRRIEPEPALEAMRAIAVSMSGQLSSTAQDLARGRATEIDDLNGMIVRRGAELGVAVPVNQTLHALIKLAERRASTP